LGDPRRYRRITTTNPSQTDEFAERDSSNLMIEKRENSSLKIEKAEISSLMAEKR